MIYLMADDSLLKSLEKRVVRLEEKVSGFMPEPTEDEQFDEAVKLVSRYDKISPSLLQRSLNIGYARAARIADRLEKRGYIIPTKNHYIYQVVLGKRKKFLGLF